MAFWAHFTQPCSLSYSTGQSDKFKPSSNEWILLNINVTGYYLVNYDESNWQKLQNQLQADLSVGIPAVLCPTV